MTTKQIEKFCAYLIKQANNNSAYLWGGQGEYVTKTTLGKVLDMETSNTNVARILRYTAGKLESGADMSKARYFDCSGLIVNWLLAKGLITSDMTANDLYKLCEPVELTNLKKGDLTFKLANGKAVHVGACVDADKKEIVESYGRDKGVIKRPLGYGSSWNAAGRLKL